MTVEPARSAWRLNWRPCTASAQARRRRVTAAGVSLLVTGVALLATGPAALAWSNGGEPGGYPAPAQQPFEPTDSVNAHVEQLALEAEASNFWTSDPFSPASLMSNVDSYAALPDHYSGTPNDAFELGVIGRELAADGVELGGISYEFPEYDPTRVALTVGPTQEPTSALAPLQYSGLTAPGGLSGQLFYGGTGNSSLSGAEGKIVVFSGENLDGAVEAAAAAHAAAVIAVTKGYADYARWEDVNARDGTGTLPVVLVGKQTGPGIVSAAEAGESANVVEQAQTGVACDSDVWGVLPGSDPSRRIFVGTPASSMVPAASERGTGDAILLALARYYSRLPLRDRPATLVFLFTTGHEVGFLGLPALIDSSYGSWFTGAEAYVHIGSSLGAPEEAEEANGEVQTTSAPYPTGALHYSENPLIEETFPKAFAESALTLPSTPAHVATAGEQVDAYTHGVPTVGFSGGSLYFHTDADLPSTVDPTLLAQEAEGFRRIVEGLAAEPAGSVKAANAQAEAYGAEIDPNTRDPSNPVLGAAGVGGPEPTVVPTCPTSWRGAGGAHPSGPGGNGSGWPGGNGFGGQGHGRPGNEIGDWSEVTG